MFYSNQSQLSVEEINDPQLPALTEYLWGDSTCSNVWGEDLLPNGDDYINHTRVMSIRSRASPTRPTPSPTS